MKNYNSIYDLIYDSPMTLFGFTVVDEFNVYKFFNGICYKNPDKVVRLHSHSAPEYNSFNNESYYITTFEEIYEIIPRLENKIIIIDNLSDLHSINIDDNQPMGKSRMLSKLLQDLSSYYEKQGCIFIVGNFMYETPINSIDRSYRFKGGDSILYTSDNVFVINNGVMNCQKSRYCNPNEYKDVNLVKLYLRDDNLRLLLD